MDTRRLGKTGFNVSVIGFGAWAIGADWGDVDDETSMQALHAAVDAGVTFFDTADAYGDGRSERLIARLRRERDEDLVVATKLGRRLPGSVGRRLFAGEHRILCRAVADEPRDRLPRSRPAALPSDGPLLPPGGVRHHGRASERWKDCQLWRLRRTSGGGAKGARLPRCLDDPDHLQHLSPTTGGSALPCRPDCRCRDHRTRAFGFGPAHGQDNGRYRLCGQ